MKLLLWGRPGCGKSLLVHILRKEGYAVLHADDYPLLCQMYRQEGEATGRFRTVSCGNFDVLDHAVYDEALQILEHHLSQEKGESLVIIEFARDDYCHALAQFSPDFLRDARLLYLATPLTLCLERIATRVRSGTGHAVSREVMQD